MEQTREEVDAKIARAVSEVHVELARLNGKIDVLAVRLDALTVRVEDLAKDVLRLWGGMKFIVGTTITVGLALAGLIVTHH